LVLLYISEIPILLISICLVKGSIPINLPAYKPFLIFSSLTDDKINMSIQRLDKLKNNLFDCYFNGFRYYNKESAQIIMLDEF